MAYQTLLTDLENGNNSYQRFWKCNSNSSKPCKHLIDLGMKREIKIFKSFEEREAYQIDKLKKILLSNDWQIYFRCKIFPENFVQLYQHKRKL